jgi:hypothetical protein
MGEAMGRLREAIAQAAGQYYRLILLAGAAGSGKTALLQTVAAEEGYPLVNINLELSKRLLDLPRTQRVRQVERFLKDVIASVIGDVVLLDNLEILFDPTLEIEPLRLLQVSSRNRTLVASWNGQYKDDSLSYAEPGHPEYVRFNVNEALVVTVEESTKT